MYQKIVLVISWIILTPILLGIFYFFATIFFETRDLASLGVLLIICSLFLGLMAGTVNIFGKQTRYETAEIQRDFNAFAVRGQFGRATQKYAEGVCQSFSKPWIRFLNTASALTLAFGVFFAAAGLV